MRLPQLFKRVVDQYDKLRKRNAFLEGYKKESIFENSLDEFDESRCEPLLLSISFGLMEDSLAQRGRSGFDQRVCCV